MGGLISGVACGHIKAFGLCPFPHQTKICVEGLQGRHALSMLGRTLKLATFFLTILDKQGDGVAAIITNAYCLSVRLGHNIIQDLFKEFAMGEGGGCRCFTGGEGRR